VEALARSSETLSERVRRTLEDLDAIQRSLGVPASLAHHKSNEPTLPLDLELAAELKSVVDVLRKLLWAYITALSAKSGRQPMEVLEWYKMELAVEMLRNASSRSPSTQPESANSAFSFEELVTRVLAVTAMHTTDEHAQKAPF